MSTYDYKKAEVLMELIDRFGNKPLNKNSSEDMRFLENSLKKLQTYIDQEYKDMLGNTYETVDFKTINGNDNTLGSYISNVRADRNGHINKRTENNVIRVNLFNYCSDKYLGSDDESKRIGAYIHLIETLEHEYTHYHQNIQRIQGKLSSGSIESAKQSIVTMLNHKDVYDKNYWSMSDEIEARINAYEKTNKVIECISDKEKARIYKEYHDKFINSTEFDKYLGTTATFREGNAGSQDKDYFFNQRADEYIKNNPDILNIFKILQNEYNMDGTKKGVVQLLNECIEKMKKALSKEGLAPEKKEKLRLMIRNSYFDIIESRLHEITLDEAKQIESEFNTNDLYDKMYKYYESKYNQKLADYEKIEKMYETDESLRAKTNNTSKRTFYKSKESCKEKYERVLANVSRLKNKYYKMDNSIINGVDIPGVPKVKLDEESCEKRESFLKQMLNTYSIIESDNDYDFDRRKSEEERFSKMIMNAVNTGRCATGFTEYFNKANQQPYKEKQIKLMMAMLKTADTLTIEGGPNILQDFMDTPFINNTLIQMREDSTYKKMKDNADTIKQFSVKETENDRAKRIANEKMKTLSKDEAKTQFKKYMRHSSTSRYAHENPSDEWKDAIYRISALQQGYTVGPTDKSGYMTIQNRESTLINADDIRNLGRSNVVKDVVVNGISYPAIVEKNLNERT